MLRQAAGGRGDDGHAGSQYPEQAAPDLEISSMVARQIAPGLITELTDDTIVTFERYPFLFPRFLLLIPPGVLVIWGVWSVTKH